MFPLKAHLVIHPLPVRYIVQGTLSLSRLFGLSQLVLTLVVCDFDRKSGIKKNIQQERKKRFVTLVALRLALHVDRNSSRTGRMLSTRKKRKKLCCRVS